MFKWLVFFCAFAAANAFVYEGQVFSDRNGNGVCDGSDMCLSGVSVSDGMNVTETDAEGKFSLPGHERARFVFVTVPSGYKTDNAHYQKITPGKNVYDFALKPYDACIGTDGSHSFVQVTDTEIFNTDNNGEWVDNVRECAKNAGAAFIVHTGDICYENGLKSHIGLMNTGNMGVPVYYGIGNHDLVKGKYGEELFESIYGPAWYSFDVAGTHYVMLPMLSGDFKPSYTRSDVAAWLANDLSHISADTPVVIFSHNLLTYGDSFIYEGDNGQNVDLDAYNLRAWIYGHIHTNYVRRQGDVLTVCTSSSDKAGIDHSMGGFRVFTVGADGSLSMNLRFPYLYDRSEIASPSGVVSTKKLTVNAYSTSSDVRSITASCFSDGREVFRNLSLVRRTGWTWTADMPIDSRHEGEKMRQISLSRCHANGLTCSEIPPILPQRRPSVLAYVWPG